MEFPERQPFPVALLKSDPALLEKVKAWMMSVYRNYSAASSSWGDVVDQHLVRALVPSQMKNAQQLKRFWEEYMQLSLLSGNLQCAACNLDCGKNSGALLLL
jgi:hypothetical protein